MKTRPPVAIPIGELEILIRRPTATKVGEIAFRVVRDRERQDIPIYLSTPTQYRVRI